KTRTNANDPANWTAAMPTPGAPTAAELIDTDGDGMPDGWEQANHTDPLVADASEDPDHDGMTNLQEFLAGTDPNDPSSVLRIGAVEFDTVAAAFVLSFEAVANRTYTVQCRTNIATGLWQSLESISAAPANRTINVTNAPANCMSGFYRLITPAAQ